MNQQIDLTACNSLSSSRIWPNLNFVEQLAEINAAILLNLSLHFYIKQMHHQ